jgi:hypothetical protein
MNPNLEQPHYYRAAAFYHLGLLEAVEAEVTEGLRINPVNKLEALRVRGSTALIAGRSSEAVALLEEARGVSSASVFRLVPGPGVLLRRSAGACGENPY